MLPHDLYRGQLTAHRIVYASCIWLFDACVQLHTKAKTDRSNEFFCGGLTPKTCLELLPS